MAARFGDGTHADYEIWGTAAEAARRRGSVDGGSAEVRGNVVVYPGRSARGRADAATTVCVPR